MDEREHIFVLLQHDWFKAERKVVKLIVILGRKTRFKELLER